MPGQSAFVQLQTAILWTFDYRERNAQVHNIQIESEVLNEVKPVRLTRVVYRSGTAAGRAYVRNPGAVGYRVVTYRVALQGSQELRRERLSDDSYEAMNHILQVTETEAR